MEQNDDALRQMVSKLAQNPLHLLGPFFSLLKMLRGAPSGAKRAHPTPIYNHNFVLLMSDADARVDQVPDKSDFFPVSSCFFKLESFSSGIQVA